MSADPAQTRATRAIEETLRRAERAYLLGGKQVRTLMSDAEALLGARLAKLVAKHGGPSGKHSEEMARLTLEQVKLVTEYVQKRLLGLTEENARAAVEQGFQGTVSLAKQLEGAFTGISRPLNIESATMMTQQVSGAASTLLSRHKSCVQRYGDAMIEDFSRNIRTGIVEGLTNSQLISRIIAAGALNGVTAAGLHGKEPKSFPNPSSGFLARTYWAERIVRTETAYAYNRGNQASIDALQQTDFPDMGKKILAHFDKRTAPDSIAVHGQIRRASELFMDGAGRQYMHPPARPNDRETVIPWRVAWREVPITAPAAPAEVAKAQLQAAGSKLGGGQRRAAIAAKIAYAKGQVEAQKQAAAKKAATLQAQIQAAKEAHAAGFKAAKKASALSPGPAALKELEAQARAAKAAAGQAAQSKAQEALAKAAAYKAAKEQAAQKLAETQKLAELELKKQQAAAEKEAKKQAEALKAAAEKAALKQAKAQAVALAKAQAKEAEKAEKAAAALAKKEAVALAKEAAKKEAVEKKLLASGHIAPIPKYYSEWVKPENVTQSAVTSIKAHLSNEQHAESYYLQKAAQEKPGSQKHLTLMVKAEHAGKKAAEMQKLLSQVPASMQVPPPVKVPEPAKPAAPVPAPAPAPAKPAGSPKSPAEKWHEQAAEQLKAGTLSFKHSGGYTDVFSPTGEKLTYFKSADGTHTVSPPAHTGLPEKKFTSQEAAAEYALKVSREIKDKASEQQKAAAAAKAEAEKQEKARAEAAAIISREADKDREKKLAAVMAHFADPARRNPALTELPVLKIPEDRRGRADETLMWDGSKPVGSIRNISVKAAEYIKGEGLRALHSFTGSGYGGIRASETTGHKLPDGGVYYTVKPEGQRGGLSQAMNGDLRRAAHLAPEGLEVWRGITVGKETAEHFLKEATFQLGGTSSTAHQRYVSNQASFGAVYESSDGLMDSYAGTGKVSVLFRLRNKTGIPIQTMSSVGEGEHEVLVPADAKFRTRAAYWAPSKSGEPRVLIIETEED